AVPPAPATNLPNGAAPLAIEVGFAEMTFGSRESVVREIPQDGFTRGEIVAISVDKQGKITGRASNGESLDIGQVRLGTVRNPNGLFSLGDNLWAETGDSGQVVPGDPGTGQNG